MASSAHIMGPNHRDRIVKAASIRLSDEPARSTTDYAEVIVGDGAPSGGYGRDSGASLIYIRKDASTANTVQYVSPDGGSNWSAVEARGDAGTFTSIDLDGTLDQDAALTAAGDGQNVAVTINHATAAAEGIDVSVAQLTTARTSGTVAAVQAKTTSLAGDSGGEYVSFLAAAPTDGGGSAVHYALQLGAGYDALADLSACASGEADLILGDNLAVALQVREAANSYLTFVTTNGAEAVQVDKELLLPNDGISAGIAVMRLGATATEGLELRVSENTISPSAIETAVCTIPANSRIVSVQSNVQSALTGGGSTDSYGIGVAADPDKYGSSATLTQNSKSDFIGDGTQLTSTEAIVLTGTASETADGDTALTVGSVRIRIVYWTLNSLDDA